MIEDIFTFYYVAISFLGVIAMLWIVFEATERKPTRQKEKQIMFACGTESSPEDLNVSSWNYYEYMKKFLLAGHLSRLHSGKLSTYMAWILIGMVVIFSVMLIAW